MRVRIAVLMGLAAVGVTVGVRPMGVLGWADGGVIATADAGTPLSYEDWIDDAIGKIAGDNPQDQARAVEQLGIVIVNPADREKVLGALQPHLQSNDAGFRQRCVVAYGHWATGQEIQQLLGVVLEPESPQEMRGCENSWVAAVSSLVNLDPATARSAIGRRTGDFFFRSGMVHALEDLTSDTGPGQADAFEMLFNLDPRNDLVRMSEDESISMLRNDSAADRVKGAKALAHAAIREDHRDAVLEALRPHLMGDDGRARLAFVEAYAHWATPREIPTLQAIIAYPATVQGLTGQENCWAAATVALARLDKQAAADAVGSRAGYFFYRTSLHGYLLPVANGNGPNAAMAGWLMFLLDENNSPPVAPGFAAPGLTAPAAPGMARNGGLPT